jgi:FtsH-binding integral membrane protein
MSRFQQQQGYDASYGAVAEGRAEVRERFIVRTYNRLFLAILAFAGIEIGLFYSGVAEVIAQTMFRTNWLVILGAFMIVSWGATHVAHRAISLGAQYAALAAYVVGQAIIFVPLLYIANAYAPGAIRSAAVVTFAGFAGLTGIAFWTRKDFSFLRTILLWGGVCALLLIGASVLFGFVLGTMFSVAMVCIAGASILYNTSNVLHHYPENRYVAAALQLFASVALMFWYVLQLFIGSRR